MCWLPTPAVLTTLSPEGKPQPKGAVCIPHRQLASAGSVHTASFKERPQGATFSLCEWFSIYSLLTDCTLITYHCQSGSFLRARSVPASSPGVNDNSVSHIVALMDELEELAQLFNFLFSKLYFVNALCVSTCLGWGDLFSSGILNCANEPTSCVCEY